LLKIAVTDNIGYMERGQWMTSESGAIWLFDTGAPSLDFAYTGWAPQWETLHAPVDLATWLESRYGGPFVDADDRDLSDARVLREALVALAQAAAASAELPANHIDTLNLFAATPDMPPTLAGGRRQAGAARARTAQALSSLARNAVALLSESAERYRACDATDCGFIFYDESRTANRRWCSMQRCGNRAKVRAFRAKSGSERLLR
jgi:predicted RNA-binding Zn ribbon-like protein